MRLLFLTFHFPPFNASAAVRTGQTAKHLRELGHDVRVVSADYQPTDQSLKLEIPRDSVVYTPWIGYRLESLVKGCVPQSTRPSAAVPGTRERRIVLPRAFRRGLRHAKENLVYIPDDCIGWYPYAVRAALQMTRNWDFDLIYASAGPDTSLLVAAHVAKVRGLPWVGELRDLWSDNHYRWVPPWYRGIDAWLERRVLGSAAGLITMSEPWKHVLQERYTMPVEVIYNGFESRDATIPSAAGDSRDLVVAHLGTLYGGNRDPGPLFEAIRALGDDAKYVRVEFYGSDEELTRRLARSWGVADRVSVLPPVPYAEALSVQARSDVLLLLMWDRPEEEGVLPGKLFEYIGARRPVLVVGAASGSAAQLVSSRRLGLASSDPAEIALQLATWIAEKRATGRLESLPSTSTADFSRAHQVQRLSDFFDRLVNAR